MRRLEYIAHHGILGMKWGIRHTPAQLGHRTPKPRKLESGKTGDYKNDGKTVKQTYGKGKTRLVQSRNGEPPKNSSGDADNSKSREKTLRKVAIGLGVGAAAAGAGYALYKTGALEKGADSLKRLATSKFHSWDKDVITAATARDDDEKQLLKDAMKVNKGGNIGRTMLANRDHNCGFCALTFDANQRGESRQAKAGKSYVALSISDMMAKSYENADSATVHDFGVCPDKDAIKRATQYCREAGLTRFETKSYIKNKMREATEEYVKKDPLTRTQEIVNALKGDNGGNSRGILTVGWYTDKRESGSSMCPHSINYVVKNGKTYFVDSQCGSVMRPDQFARTYGSRMSGMTAYRTDNLKPVANLLNTVSQKSGSSPISSLKGESLSDYGKKVVRNTSIGSGVLATAGAGIAVGKSKVDALLNSEKKEKRDDNNKAS